ncbi:hypothetical protein ACFFMN_18605 [Planobispora siamensis]|uniref:Uncharacterized protein n=1 Tax=Planobispora siamensis TaxID=936338 RepID=A0A8J3WP07_9ACTN|nr:hypothetical protein [Planobispora siamensis]GIH94441.1 hypothetical protein Psi01_50710 [Planobispora siamensis]
MDDAADPYTLVEEQRLLPDEWPVDLVREVFERRHPREGASGDRLRDVLCEALAERRPCDYALRRETWILLAVPGPVPKRKAPDWRHRAVAPSLPRLAARRKAGTLAYAEGRPQRCRSFWVSTMRSRPKLSLTPK